MYKCKTDFKGCCCNIDGQCVAYGSCNNKVFVEEQHLESEDNND